MGRHRAWTHDEIIAAIREWTERHGRTPRLLEWSQTGRAPWGKTVIDYFGSWSKAIEAAGFKVPCGRRPCERPDHKEMGVYVRKDGRTQCRGCALERRLERNTNRMRGDVRRAA